MTKQKFKTNKFGVQIPITNKNCIEEDDIFSMSKYLNMSHAEFERCFSTLAAIVEVNQTMLETFEIIWEAAETQSELLVMVWSFSALKTRHKLLEKIMGE